MVTFTANAYTPLDRGMVLIQLCAESFHKKTVSKTHAVLENFPGV